MLVLSSPSGAGKTTLSRMLLESEDNITMSVSATTRPKRPAEKDGEDYSFVGEEAFNRMIAKGAFLEHAQVFGNQYGTPKAAVEERLSQGHDVLFDIDWQGTQQLKEQARSDLVSIFILPPTAEELEGRLRRRAQDSAEVVQRRMAEAADEMTHYAEYDYVIVNDGLDSAHAQIKSILHAERLRLGRQSGVADFVNELRGDL